MINLCVWFVTGFFCCTVQVTFISSTFGESSIESSTTVVMGEQACFGFATLFWFFLPLLVANEVAAVSTVCDDIKIALNNYMLADLTSYDTVNPLLNVLKTLNNGQGLGFAYISNGRALVIHKALIIRLGTAVTAALTSAIPILLTWECL